MQTGQLSLPLFSGILHFAGADPGRGGVDPGRGGVHCHSTPSPINVEQTACVLGVLAPNLNHTRLIRKSFKFPKRRFGFKAKKNDGGHWVV